jgi:hypothetical protein
MTFVLVWWFVSAHKWFKGPVINVEHAMLGGEGAVLDGMEHGMEHSSDSDAHSKKAEAEGLHSTDVPPRYNEIEG